MERKTTAPITLEEFRKKHKKLRDTYSSRKTERSRLDVFAVWITRHVGTMGFFLIIFIWTVLWLGWNTLAPKDLQFDPPTGFVFWLFISNMIQLFLMPLIMIGQNIESHEAELRTQHDLEVNIKAEEEIEIVLRHLEYQQGLLLDIMKRIEQK